MVSGRKVVSGCYQSRCDKPSSVAKSAPRRKTGAKTWIPNRSRRNMVLGDDLGLEEAVSLAVTALVGRLSYRSRCSTPITEWVRRFWVPLQGYELEVFYLERGWFGFKFTSPEDSSKILEKTLDFL